MKAISIKQPFAWLLVNGFKDLENRNWKTNFRGEILIHASKDIDVSDYAFVKANYQDIDLPKITDFEKGGIVGKITITEVVDKSKSRWFFGKYGFLMETPIKCKFFPCKGALSLWDFDETQLKFEK